MKCASCGKETAEKGVIANGMFFCNNLCRYVYFKDHSIDDKRYPRREPTSAGSAAQQDENRFLKDIQLFFLALASPSLFYKNIATNRLQWIGFITAFLDVTLNGGLKKAIALTESLPLGIMLSIVGVCIVWPLVALLLKGILFLFKKSIRYSTVIICSFIHIRPISFSQLSHGLPYRLLRSTFIYY
jgi:hypothetical protein